MTSRKKKDIILGAGLAGLSAGFHLKDDYALYEKEASPGGMARSIKKDGYTFDLDGHLLHFRRDYVFKLLNGLLGGNLAPHKRSSWIYSKGSFTRYPFQANFYGLPKPIVKDCLLGLIKARRESVSPNGNFENWIKKTFGEGIADHFMLPYNRKFWTIEPKDITCDWLDGFVPVPSLEDAVQGAITDNNKSYGYNSKFWYPVKGGISEIVKGFLKKVGSVHTNKEAVRIGQHKKNVLFSDGKVLDFNNLISTMPLPELVKILKKVPNEIKDAADKLKFISVLVLNIGVNREDVTDRHWVYYPEKELDFYRIGFPTNFSMDVAPPKKTSMYVEISYRDRKIDIDKAISRTVKHLKALGMIREEGEIDLCLPVDIKYGYVIYDKFRNDAVKTIKDYLAGFNIHPIGRYGGWKYMSMEDVILEGKEIAECLRIS
ncbi:MAG: FAD-dependent oxidoreductase [Candidatus Omnitrophota bacterium]